MKPNHPPIFEMLSHISCLGPESVAFVVRLTNIGRLGAVGMTHRFHSGARRTASADSYLLALACFLASFVHRCRVVIASDTLPCVSPLRGPTLRCRGRAAIKLRRAPELGRYAATNLHHAYAQ